jgi:thioesterase domain-containing protein
MAIQLREQGEEVALLAIFDSGAPVRENIPYDQNGPLEYDVTTFLEEIVWLVGRLLKQEIVLPPEELRGRDVEAQMQVVLDKLKSVNFFPPDTGTKPMQGMLNVHHSNSLAAWKYIEQARPYDAAVTLFLADNVLACDFRGQDRDLFDDPTVGWSKLVSGPIDIQSVPGDHISMLSAPHVEEFAAKLRACLDRAAAQAEEAAR